MSNTAADIFRDYVTPGVPSSGAWQPQKSAIRGLLSGTGFNVKAYGALGDGVTDDTAAFNSAIADAAAAGGGIVLVPPSATFVIGSVPVALASNVWLRGAGPSSILKSIAGRTGNMISGNSLTNVSISDLTIDGGNLGIAGTLLNNVFFQSCSQLAIDRLNIINASAFGIFVQGCTDFRVADNTVNFTTALNTQNQSITLSAALQNLNGKVLRNRLINSGIIASGANLVIDGNIVSGVKFGAGIASAESSFDHDWIVSNNVCYNGTGVDVNSTACEGMELWGPRFTVIGNLCFSNSGPGIFLGGSNCVVSGNICYDNCANNEQGTGGIVLGWVSATYNASNNVIIGNSSFNQSTTNQLYGIQDFGTTLPANNIIVGNRFQGATAPTNINSTTSVVDAEYELPAAPNNAGSQTFAPTLTANGGSITYSVLSANYIKLGSYVYFQAVFHLTVDGGTGFLTMTLPTTANNSGSASGLSTAHGWASSVRVAAGTNTAVIAKYDGSYPTTGGGGADFQEVSGFYFSS